MASLIFFTVLTILLLALPKIMRFKIAILSSIFQIFTLPILGIYPSIAFLSTLSLTPSLIRYKQLKNYLPLTIFMVFISWQFTSLLWSPNKHLGLATITHELPFLILSFFAAHLGHKDPQKLFKLIKAYACLSLIPLSLVFFFRLYFYMNELYLHSSLVNLLINPKTISWYFDNKALVHSSIQTPINQPLQSLHFNIMHFDFGGWSNKPRVLFTNPNVEGGYLGVCALLFVGTGIYCKSLWLKSIGTLHWIGVILTASIVAISLSIALPLCILIYYLSATRKLKTRNIIIASLITALFSAIYFIMSHPTVYAFVSSKIHSRFIFWETGKNIIGNDWLFGHGFGSWKLKYEQYRQSLSIIDPHLAPEHPPHNTFIYLISQSGVIAALLCSLFMISIVIFWYKAHKTYQYLNTRIGGLFFLSAFILTFLQGLSENWGIIGEMHIQPLLAIAFGVLSIKNLDDYRR